jgi:hypothetical protein
MSCFTVVPVTSTCAFRGAETACGTCLASRCGAQIGACCSDSACGGLIQDVELCAAAASERCKTLLAAGESTEPSARTSLQSCAKNRCAAVCQTRTGNSETNCKDAFFGNGFACACTTSEPFNDYACAASIQPVSKCCAPRGWPGTALECTCKAVACYPTAEGCSCVLSDDVSAGVARECTGLHCCAGSGVCACRARACDKTLVEVPSCGIGALSCESGLNEVPACSIRK